MTKTESGQQGGICVHSTLIRDQANALFSRISFAKTSVADIAKACGLGKGTIYLYFKSKDDIARAIIEERRAKIVAETESFFQDASISLSAKLERFFSDLVEESFALKRLIFGDFENVSGGMLKDVFFKYGRYFEWCVDQLASIVSPYEPYSLRPVDALREDLKLLLELMIGRVVLFLVARDWNDKDGLKAIVAPLSRKLFDSLVAGQSA
jgi:AcrR family transcriptional regulator